MVEDFRYQLPVSLCSIQLLSPLVSPLLRCFEKDSSPWALGHRPGGPCHGLLCPTVHGHQQAPSGHLILKSQSNARWSQVLTQVSRISNTSDKANYGAQTPAGCEENKDTALWFRRPRCCCGHYSTLNWAMAGIVKDIPLPVEKAPSQKVFNNHKGHWRQIPRCKVAS